MTTKSYIPISVLIFAAMIFTARYFEVPAAPLAFVVLVGAILIGILMAHQKVYRLLESVVYLLKYGRKPVKG